MAADARSRMMTKLRDNGWEPNTNQTYLVGAYRHRSGEDEREVRQHPGHWLKRTADGTGRWELYLDYEVPNAYVTRFDNRLRRVNVGYRPDDENAEGSYHSLRAPSRSRYYRSTPDPLWSVLGDSDASLRERTEKLVTNVELALWLAAEEKQRRTVAAHERATVAMQDRELRARPLPVTVQPVDFKRLTKAAWDAARAVDSADGKSDLPALVADLEDAVAAIRAVVKVEVDA